MQTTTVCLTDEELAALDGHVSAKVQAEVSKALAQLEDKKGLGAIPDQYRDFAARIIEEAKSAGKLVFWQKRLRNCNVCGKAAGYAKYKRCGKYHDKGDPNYDKPLTFGGIELADRSIVIKNRVSLGCCLTCWKEVKPFLGDALRGVKAAMPEKITGYPPKWKWRQNRCCTKCGWEGHEGQMHPHSTMMGDGYYPAGCPALGCTAENLGFGPTLIKIADGFTLEVVG